MIDRTLAGWIVLWSTVTVALLLGVWKRKAVWARVFAVAGILAVGFVSCFGVQLSSRLAIMRSAPAMSDPSRASWEEGAVAARLVAQDYLPIGAYCALALAALSLLPVVRGRKVGPSSKLDAE